MVLVREEGRNNGKNKTERKGGISSNIGFLCVAETSPTMAKMVSASQQCLIVSLKMAEFRGERTWAVAILRVLNF